MGGWLALIPRKWQLWAAGVLFFCLALIGIRVAIRRQAFAEVENTRARKRLEAVIESKRIEDDVQNMDREALIRAASKWVR